MYTVVWLDGRTRLMSQKVTSFSTQCYLIPAEVAKGIQFSNERKRVGVLFSLLEKRGKNNVSRAQKFAAPMSCNYADGLSKYENKGVLGVPEIFDSPESIETKCEELARMILASRYTVVHTGAGISTSAGIPDFRGPKGVWTLEEKGEKPSINVSFDQAIPTKTHLALKALVTAGHVQYIVSQNIDGLHLRSGLAREYLSELHGNMFIEVCCKCRRQYVRSTPAPTVGKKLTGNVCKGSGKNRACRGGNLIDNILDWEHDLPENDLQLAFMHSAMAELNICLGTTLQIVPSGDLPLKNQKYDGKLVVCNLQPTKHDKKSNLKISAYVDLVLEKVTKRLGVEIPDYLPADDPTKRASYTVEWSIPDRAIKMMDKIYYKMVKEKGKSKKRLSARTNEEEKKEIKSNVKKLRPESALVK